MVTPEDKLELVAHMRDLFVENDETTVDGHTSYSSILFEALYDSIVVDIKKSIPVVITDAETFSLKGRLVHYANCPVCSSGVTDLDDFRVCSTCGQALDWSEYDK